MLLPLLLCPEEVGSFVIVVGTNMTGLFLVIILGLLLDTLLFGAVGVGKRVSLPSSLKSPLYLATNAFNRLFSASNSSRLLSVNVFKISHLKISHVSTTSAAVGLFDGIVLSKRFNKLQMPGLLLLRDSQ